ncbi:MAG: SsrA-binding protein SmpB [Armatimonadetes bacterium]|nr:SsrA-binding protein SmpB [Armatimonadota bacterium]
MRAKQTVATNRRARHDYFIEDTFEAGLVLTGPEVKSLRAHQVSLQEAYATIEDGELWLVGMHIAPYKPAHDPRMDPRRPRKLLVKRRELKRLIGRVAAKGYTLIPLRVYFNERGYAKVEIGLARGKRQYDKREAIAEREYERRVQRLTGRRTE